MNNPSPFHPVAEQVTSFLAPLEVVQLSIAHWFSNRESRDRKIHFLTLDNLLKIQKEEEKGRKEDKDDKCGTKKVA